MFRLEFWLVFVCASLGSAQTSSNLSGFGLGSVKVTTNPNRLETVVLFKSPAHRAVFLLQSESGADLTKPWSGKAQLFISDGVLAVLGEHGEKQIFRFDERSIPTSLTAAFGVFENHPIFGIAHYGDDRGLKRKQVAHLREFGALRL